MELVLPFLLVVIINIKISCATTEPRVIAEAPVQPVKQGAVLSFYCKVSNLDESIHEVTISRQTANQKERLSYNKGILDDVDERVFLALRLLEDGSSVYFLTITNVMISDEGRYSCKVMQSSDDADIVVARGSADILVQHFPEETYPICSSSLSTRSVKEGTRITLNCTSEEGFPVSTITWTRNGFSSPYNVEQVRKDGKIEVVLSMILSRHDDEAIFMCKLHNDAFPEKGQLCHIGPLNVIPSSNSVDSQPNVPEVVATKPPAATMPEFDFPHLEEQPHDCRNMCPLFSSPTTYWIIATVAALLVAIIFFVIAITIAIKLHRKATLGRQDYVKAVLRQPGELRTHDEIYEKLRYRTDDDRVYMALERARKPASLVVSPHVFDMESNYTGTPTTRN